MARLKVYQASLDGVNDWIVAAPNQRAALDAWGVHRNLFADGEAFVATDAAAVEAGMARPGVALRRPKGGKGPFISGEASDASGWSAAAQAVGARKAPARKVKAVDRSKLDAAEKALERFEAAADAQLSDLARQRAALDRQEMHARAALAEQRRVLQAAIESERAAIKQV
jgi:hypothetical protein